MMPNITRGAKIVGLMVYLQGPGKANEHENQHVIGGHSSIMSRPDISGVLDAGTAKSIGQQIDGPRRAFGVEVTRMRKGKAASQFGRGGTATLARDAAVDDVNVWHCSLSLSPEEGPLSDEKWQAIAADFMKEMGFDDPASPRASARWVAVRHGLSGTPSSATRNDHIHIAASVVREDGTKVSTWNDRPRAQKAANAIEHRHGLQVLQSREQELGARGIKPAEQARMSRAGRTESERETLARRVRAAATASKSEAEFVRRVRAGGVLVRPRFSKGDRSHVEGYSVALRPDRSASGKDATPIFYGGGRLGKDLTLPRLRKEWEDSPTASSEAVDEWRSARRERPAARPGREAKMLDPKLLDRAARDIAAWNKYLASIPVTDRAQWARAAGRTAGVFDAWSVRTEATPGPLAHAAKQLARSSQIPAHQHAPKKAGVVSAGGAALILMQTSPQLGKAASYALLMRQLIKTVEAIAAAHRAAGDLSLARDLEITARVELESIHRQMPQPRAEAEHVETVGGVAVLERPVAEEKTTEEATAPPEPALGDAATLAAGDFPVSAREAAKRGPSPLPSPLDPQREQTRAGRTRDPGVER